jgi:multimeric flavodoxin WrbA
LIEDRLREVAVQHGETLETETIYLAHMDLHPCRGCRVCFNNGEDKCPLKDDDLFEIKAKMKAADGIIFASPVYVGDANGVMKNLIDRLAYICHRPEFAGKCAYFLATTGSSSTSHTIRTMQATISWGFCIVGSSGFKTGAKMTRDEIASRHQKEIDKAARRIFRAIGTKKFAKPSFLSLMVFKIQQRSWSRAAPDSFDYAYWERQGWIDPRREFFIRHDAGRVTVAFARLVGGVLARLWT